MLSSDLRADESVVRQARFQRTAVTNIPMLFAEEDDMPLSKEVWEYHLTTNGWVEGSFYGDCLGGRIIRDTPSDRVLTVHVVDVLAAPLAKPHVYDQVVWTSGGREQIAQLITQFGKRPGLLPENWSMWYESL